MVEDKRIKNLDALETSDNADKIVIYDVEDTDESKNVKIQTKQNFLKEVVLSISNIVTSLSNYLTKSEAITTYEPLLPITPENPDTKFLNGNKEWASIAIGAGGFAGNLYFTTLDSDITGYKKISYDNEVAETELTASLTNQEALLRTYLYDTGIETDIIDAGVWIANFRVKVSGSQGISQLKFEAFLRHADNSETTLFSSYSPEINNTDYVTLRSESNQPAFNCVSTDRLGVRIYAKTTASNSITFSTIVGDGNASYFTTPLRIRHDQLRDLNGDENYLHITSEEKEMFSSKSFVITNPTAGMTYALWKAPTGITIVGIDAVQIGGTNLVGILTECDADGLNPVVVDSTDMTITTSNTSKTSFTNPSIDSGDWVGWKNTSINGAVSRLMVTFKYK